MEAKNELAPIAGTKLLEEQLKGIHDTITGDFYVLSKKKVPDSRIIQSLANKFDIKTKEVFSEQTDSYAKVVVGCTSPNGRYAEDVVIHNFKSILEDKIVSMFDKEIEAKKEHESRPISKDRPFKPVFFNDLENPFDVDKNGSLIPNLTFKGKLKIFNDMSSFKKFAIRDAYSKAANRAQRRLLNQEFRDQEEIQLEDDEVKAVNKGKTVKKQEASYKVSKDTKKTKEEKTEKNEAIEETQKEENKESDNISYIKAQIEKSDNKEFKLPKNIHKSLKEPLMKAEETIKAGGQLPYTKLIAGELLEMHKENAIDTNIMNKCIKAVIK